MHSGIYIYIYIFVMAFSTWLMRVAASLVMKKPIENRFFQSFLYYVPYVTLAVMTFPAIVEATQSPADRGKTGCMVRGEPSEGGRYMLRDCIYSGELSVEN